MVRVGVHREEESLEGGHKPQNNDPSVHADSCKPETLNVYKALQACLAQNWVLQSYLRCDLQVADW